ncbi:MAG: class I SAM-dependent methyltransferase [Pseudomonadota bacterium]
MSPGACVLCGGAISVVLDGVGDHRFGIAGQWRIASCQRCGLEQIDPLPTPDQLKVLYARHYNYRGEAGGAWPAWRDRLLASPLYRALLLIDGDISFHGETGKGRLLDIGCNEGRGLVIYRRNGFSPEGLELNAPAAATARAHGFPVHEIAIEEFRPAAGFDVAVLSNVLEHALDPKAMLAAVHRLLAPGGEVWISLPNARSWLRRLFGRAWINWHVPFHITHFTLARLGRLLADHGFAVTSEKQVTPALWVAQSAIAWAAHGPPTAPRRLRSAVLVAVAMALARGLLFPLLWLGNALGRGDCLVVKARRH